MPSVWKPNPASAVTALILLLPLGLAGRPVRQRERRPGRQRLVERGGDPSREEVVEALNGHICRCTGYVKIIDAATAAIRGDVDVQGTEADMGPHDPDDVQLVPGSPA